MHIEYLYKWRIQRAEQWTTTRHCTEEEIKAEHPEAIRLPGTLIERNAQSKFMASINPQDVPF